MNHDDEIHDWSSHAEPPFAAEPSQLEHSYLLDLIKVLRPHPGGLRRWSIMRTIRKNREMIGDPVPQKMEDGIERVFRNHCADTEGFKKRGCAPETALFHWPQGKAGGVWAVYPDRADVWLAAGSATRARPDADMFQNAAGASRNRR
jgi:hypothetical protein